MVSILVEVKDMNFLKRLFGGDGAKKPNVQPMRGMEPLQTDEQQSSTRSHMEAEMRSDQERRTSQEGGPTDPQ